MDRIRFRKSALSGQKRLKPLTRNVAVQKQDRERDQQTHSAENHDGDQAIETGCGPFGRSLQKPCNCCVHVPLHRYDWMQLIRSHLGFGKIADSRKNGFIKADLSFRRLTRHEAASRNCDLEGRSDPAPAPHKKLRPAIGGWLAAREPVWDGEGWGCDRVAGSKFLVRYRSRELAVASAGRLSPSETHTLGSLCDCRLTKR